jgi:hypothetical protein
VLRGWSHSVTALGIVSGQWLVVASGSYSCLPIRGGSMPAGGVGGPVGAAEERVAHRCARRDSERVGEDRGWCLADELVPGGQPACPGGDAQLVKDADEPAVAAMFAGELPGKQPRRGRIGCGGHVAAVAQVLPQQGGNGLGHVEPVCAELEPGGAVGAGGVGGAQRGDFAGLLAVERDKAAGEAVARREGLIQQQPPDRSEPGVSSRRAGLA